MGIKPDLFIYHLPFRAVFASHQVKDISVSILTAAILEKPGFYEDCALYAKCSPEL